MRMMVVLACLGAAAACHREPAAPDPAQAASDAAANAAFQQVQQAWRAERLAQLTKPDGWASLVGMHWLDPGSHRVGSDTDNGIRLEMGPAHLGVFTVRNGATRFVADTAVTIDGTAARSSTLRSDADAQGPSVIAFDEGKGLAAPSSAQCQHVRSIATARIQERTGDVGAVVLGEVREVPGLLMDL